MRFSIKKNLIPVLLVSFIITVLVSFGIGFFVGQEQVTCPACKPEDLDFSLFWEAYHKLQEKFVDKEKFDIKNIIFGAISGMVKSLGDPYTVFFPPQETKNFIEDIKGVFEGVGMEIGISEGQLQVVAPLEGTPAQKAGLRPGDKIIKIDDKPTLDLTVEEAVNLIRGPKGTTVTLTIFREGWSKTEEFKIVRDVIEVPSLKFEMKTISDGQQIAYLRIYQFSETASFDFLKAGIEILNSPTQKIILDLRNNPGGYLEIAQDIAGWFLEKGKIVVIEDFGNGIKKEYKAEGNARLLDYKVVILINKGTASGSEILASALRDNRGILLIGEDSFGKGSVQELEKLKDGSSLKITVAKWLTPKGQLITGVGLKPDIKVEMTDKDYNEGKDPQLDKAIEIIKNL